MNRNFALLVVGQSLANIGDVLYIVSVIKTIFELTGSAASSSMVPFTITTAMFISSLLTPLLMEKLSLKWMMAGSQIGKTLLLIIMGLMFTHLTETNYYLIFFFIGLIALLDGCANPVMKALVPFYVEPEHLLKANAVTETVLQMIQALMWFVGSLLLIVLHPQQIIWLACSLFVLSSFLVCLLENVRCRSHAQKGKWAQIMEGWQVLFRTPVLKRIAWIDFFETIAATVWISAILLVFVNEALHADEKWWGFINGAFFFGMIAGSVFCWRYSAFVERRLAAFILAGSFAGFIVTLLFGLVHDPFIALLLSFSVGIFSQIKGIPQQTVIQSSVYKEQLPKVYSSLGAIGTGIFGVGSLLMGILADLSGVRGIFVLSGLLLGLITVIVYRNKQLFAVNVVEK